MHDTACAPFQNTAKTAERGCLRAMNSWQYAFPVKEDMQMTATGNKDIFRSYYNNGKVLNPVQTKDLSRVEAVAFRNVESCKHLLVATESPKLWFATF